MKTKVIISHDEIGGKFNAYTERLLLGVKRLGYLNYIINDDNSLLIADIKVFATRKGYARMMIESLVEFANLKDVSMIYGHISPVSEGNFNFYKSVGFEVGKNIVENEADMFKSEYQCRLILK